MFDPLAVGTRVIARTSGMALRVGGTVVATEAQHHVFRVEGPSGPWLWVASGRLKGWVRAADVIPFHGAFDHFSRRIERDPKDVSALLMRPIVAFDLAQYDQAIADDTEAIRLGPNDPVAYHNRGNARLARKEYDRAIADYSAAIRLDPRDAEAYHNRARRVAKDDYHLAISDENQAIRLDPGEVTRYHLRARAWAAVGSFDHALADAARALAIDPSDPSAYNLRAWIMATCPDAAYRSGPKAVADATRACTLSDWRDPYMLGTLAASCAEAGDFRAAVDWQSKALALFRASGRDDDADRARLDLYRAGKPYREPVPAS